MTLIRAKFGAHPINIFKVASRKTNVSKALLFGAQELSTLTHRHAVRDTAVSWFQSYLHRRSQSFCVAGVQTVDFILDCGVPQGSVHTHGTIFPTN